MHSPSKRSDRAGTALDPPRPAIAPAAPSHGSPGGPPGGQPSGPTASYDRPRERLRRLGPAALSDQEILTLLIGTGTAAASAKTVAAALLDQAGQGGLSTIARRTVDGLSSQDGIGTALAARLVAAFELGRRASVGPADGPRRIMGPTDVHALLGPRLRDLDQEEFHVLLLNRQHGVLNTLQITRGILDASLIHPREVYRRAVEVGAGAIIVAHNHPSGDPTPSAEDRSVTRQLAEAGRTLGIPLLDHVVIGRDGWRAISREPGGLG